MMKRAWSLAFLGLVLLLPALALAGENAVIREYYTWGGTIDVVEEAFRKLALVMSDSRYQGLFFGMAVIGIILASLGLITSSWVRGYAPTWGWLEVLVMLLVAGTVYFGFLKKKDTLYIYDQTTNEMTSVPDVPDGVIFLAGFFNRIENGLIELIDTSEPTGLSYRDGTGGVALQMLVDASRIPLGQEIYPVYTNMTLAKYFEDCWLFNMGLGYTSASDLYNPPNNNILDVLAQGVHPSKYTLWYDDDHPGGITVSCTVAWQGGTAEDGSTTVPGLFNILSAYTPTNPATQAYVNSVCAGVGFDTSNPAVRQRCMELFEATLARLMTGGVSGTITNGGMDGFLRARLAAEAIYTALDQADPSTQLRVMAERQVRSAGIGIALMANRYIPVLRAAITAIFLGMLPFLFIFMFTPAWKKVLGAAVGSFAFLCAWGVTDALVHSFIASRIVQLFSDVQSLGIDAVMVKVPKNALDAMSLFGIMRMASIFFAGLISRSLFGFGGYMLAHMASHVVGMVQGAAARGADVAFKPEVRGQTMKGVTEGTAALAGTHMAVEADGGFIRHLRSREIRSALDQLSSARAAGRLVGEYGGLGRAADAVAAAQALSTIQGAALMQRWDEAAAQAGVSSHWLMERTARWDVANRFGGAEGLERVYQGLQRIGFTGTRADMVKFVRAAEEFQRTGDAAQFHRLAENYFGGDRTKAAAVLSWMKMAPTEGFLERSGELGVDPIGLKYWEGALQAETTAGRQAVFEGAAPGTLAAVTSQEQVNEIAKSWARMAAGDIIRGGYVTEGTAAYLQNVRSALSRNPMLSSALSANLQHHLNSLNFQISNLSEARNVWSWMQRTNPEFVRELQQSGISGPQDLVGKSLTVAAALKSTDGRLQMAPIMLRGTGGFDMAEYRNIVTRTGEGYLDVAGAPGMLPVDIKSVSREGGLARIEALYQGMPITIVAPTEGVMETVEGGRPVVRLMTDQYLVESARPEAVWGALMERKEMFREVYEPALYNPQSRTMILNSLAEQAARFVNLQYGQQGRQMTNAQISMGLSTKGSIAGKAAQMLLGVEGTGSIVGVGQQAESREATINGIRTVLEALAERARSGQGSFTEEASIFLGRLQEFARSGAQVVVREDGTILVNGNVWTDAGKALKEGVWDDGIKAVGGLAQKGLTMGFQKAAEGAKAALGTAEKLLKPRDLGELARSGTYTAYSPFDPNSLIPDLPATGPGSSPAVGASPGENLTPTVETKYVTRTVENNNALNTLYQTIARSGSQGGTNEVTTSRQEVPSGGGEPEGWVQRASPEFTQQVARRIGGGAARMPDETLRVWRESLEEERERR